MRFIQGDVTRLEELDIGNDYTLIVDSGCYYGLPAGRRDAFAVGVTRLAAPAALLLMSGFTGIPLIGAGISAEELLHRFAGWRLQSTTQVPAQEIFRHTHVPLPMKAAMRSGRLEIRRFELTMPRTSADLSQDVDTRVKDGLI